MNIKEYSLIKNKYGEDMAHFCKKEFPTIMERDYALYNILTSNFNESKLLYKDLEICKKLNEFKVYIYSLFYRNISYKDTNRSVEELMNEKGYNIYECHNDDEINVFKKYYRSDEVICTFNGNRCNTHHVFFAVKKNINSIVREKVPTRDGEYGTSIISIQFLKGKNNILSIKNRYNSNVKDSDNTFDNNLENINPGLTISFEKEYGLNIRDNYIEDFSLLNYIKVDNKLYKYNMYLNNIAYGSDNIIIDNNKVINFEEKERYIVMDYFILDCKNKTITTYDKNIKDSFLDGITDIEKITVTRNKENNERTIRLLPKNSQEVIIVIDASNQIIEYYNPNIQILGNNFLKYNLELRKLYLPNVRVIGDDCLYWNYNMEELSLNNLISCGDNFICNNNYIRILNLPSLTNTGIFFCRNASQSLDKIALDSLKYLTYGSFDNEITIDRIKNYKKEDINIKKSQLVLRKIG